MMKMARKTNSVVRQIPLIGDSIGDYIDAKAIDFAKDYINNNFLEGIGKVTSLAIDKSAKSATASVKLDGEAKIVKINIDKYAVVRGKCVIKEISIDRPWLNTIANTHAVEQSFPIPDIAKDFL